MAREYQVHRKRFALIDGFNLVIIQCRTFFAQTRTFFRLKNKLPKLAPFFINDYIAQSRTVFGPISQIFAQTRTVFIKKHIAQYRTFFAQIRTFSLPSPIQRFVTKLKISNKRFNWVHIPPLTKSIIFDRTYQSHLHSQNI